MRIGAARHLSYCEQPLQQYRRPSAVRRIQFLARSLRTQDIRAQNIEQTEILAQQEMVPIGMMHRLKPSVVIHHWQQWTGVPVCWSLCITTVTLHVILMHAILFLQRMSLCPT